MLLSAFTLTASGQMVTVDVATPAPPPSWALLERELIKANASACELFFAKYFDEQGRLACVERWGGDDGPDDAIENLTNWPILYALAHPKRSASFTQKGGRGISVSTPRQEPSRFPWRGTGCTSRSFP